MDKKYYIGLDIGTDSIGWAVVNEDFEVAKGKKRINDNGKKRKCRTNLWGALLFDSGDTAKKTRLARGTRRRYRRRKERLNYLRGFFDEEITKVDDSFFIRLDESFYLKEDKNSITYNVRDREGNLITKQIEEKDVFKCPLFKTPEEEKKYYIKFPTIYHLRDHLMKSEQKEDIRLIYLALHHILKYRGHFLNEGQKIDIKNIDIAASLSETMESFSKVANESFKLPNIDSGKVNKVLGDRKKSKSKKVEELCEELAIDKKSQQSLYELFNAVVGKRIALDKIFGKNEYNANKTDEFPEDIYYKNENFDGIIETLNKHLAQNEIEVILAGRKVYDAIVLANILTEETLSASMKAKYELHSKQLRALKNFIKAEQQKGRLPNNFYNKVFSEYAEKSEDGNQDAETNKISEKKIGAYKEYIDGKGNPAKTISQEEFYKKLKGLFTKEFPAVKFPKGDEAFDWKKLDPDQTISREERIFFEDMAELMTSGDYLPKQRTRDNGSIPYQVHEHELVEIIDKQKRYYPFLGETMPNDGKGDKKYAIQMLMTFRIPYYVGPLISADLGEEGHKMSDKSRFAWLQKRFESKITPWNFNEVVDKDATSIEFIERMTSFCTYLPGEKVLPQNSLLYQEFCVYNELRTSGYFENGKKEYFGDMVPQIVNDLFKMKREVSEKDVLQYLKNSKNIEASKLFGIDRESINGSPKFNNGLSTYIDLIKMGFDAEFIDDNYKIFDEIVKWQTIFTDKVTLKRKLEIANEQLSLFSDEQIGKLSNKHYKGYGKLSAKLLNGIRDNSTGWTIIEALKNDNYYNFMRLVSGTTAGKYSFGKQIEQAQIGMTNSELSYDAVERIPGSPKVKKGIWLSLRIIKELEAFLGRANIAGIILEMSRGDGGDRTPSRYNSLERKYNNFEKANKDYPDAMLLNIVNEVQEELKLYGKKKDELNREKIFLYFLQNGIDAYTGERLSLGAEFEYYEVDHIVPQCFTSDNSLDNKVLVKRRSNQQKGGDLPSQAVVDKMKNIWEQWERAGLINAKKMKNLTLVKFGKGEIAGFINRQLVETRQITKRVASLLASYYAGTEAVVLTPNANLTSQFRDGEIHLKNPQYDPLQASGEPYIKEYLHKPYIKNRDVNDYHHAHDAYLNAVVALYLYRRYPELKSIWAYGEYQRKSRMDLGLWACDRKNISMHLLLDMREEVWKQTDHTTGEIKEFLRDEVFNTIEKSLNYKNVNIVKKTERQIGAFSEESLRQRSETNTFAMGLKRHLRPQKYGGPKSIKPPFVAVVKNKKGMIKTVGVPSMWAYSYSEATDKLKFLQEIYEDKSIVEILVPEVDIYTRFFNFNNGKRIDRLLASAQDAHKYDSYSLTVEEMNGVMNANESVLTKIFNEIGEYLDRYNVLSSKDIKNWSTSIKEKFETLSPEEKRTFILDAFHMTKLGTTAGYGVLKDQVGNKDGRYQYSRDSKVNKINNGTTLVYQSLTGLYEAQKTIK